MALTVAATAAIVLAAGSAAVVANLGILGAAANEPVGKLDANSVASLSGPVTTIDPVVVTGAEVVPVPVETVPDTAPAVTAPVGSDAPAGVHDAPAGTGSGSGTGSSTATPTPTVATTPTTIRVDNSGPGSVDGHTGSDDHGGSSGHGGADD
jgi:hypothetical protein